jgi:hypothetical protein
MPTPRMTEDEIISYLGKTSLPTLLVEGEDDAGIYRWLENQLGIFAGSILICSGRGVLISIYRRRDSFRHGKLAWLADLDMWRFSSPPNDLAGIIFTSGYSVENDLYAGSDVESLMDAAERSQHARLLAAACRWFAFEVLETQAGRENRCATHIKRVVDLATMDIATAFVVSRGFTEPASALVAQITAEYKLQLRGKTLLEVLVVFLSDSSRNPKYGYGAVIEMCLKLYPNNPHIQRIVTMARAQLA